MTSRDVIRRVIVTGGSGRVGRHVVRELAPDYDLVNADLVGTPDAEHVAVDVMRLDEVRRALKGADAVVHLAGLDYDWGFPPEDLMRVNALGTWHVLQAAVEQDLKRVVLCSSVSATGLTEMRPEWTPQQLPVDESHSCRPVDAYGLSKLVVETTARSVARGSRTSVICIRPVAVVLTETMGEYLALIQDPGKRWLFYYVTAEDVARGFRAALEVPDLRFGVFFLSADDSSLAQPTLEWYSERVGKLPLLANPRRYSVNPRASVFSSSKARDYLGWEPTSEFLALREMYEAGLIGDCR